MPGFQITVPTGQIARRSVNPMRENPIRAVVAAMRAERPLNPEQQRMRDADVRRVDALIASGHYTPHPRR